MGVENQMITLSQIKKIMKEINFFLKDVFKVLPIELDCYIQAPSLEDLEVLNLMEDTQYPYYKIIKLNKNNHSSIVDLLSFCYVSDFFQSIELKQNTKKIFEAYDGIESGIFSNTLTIPNWFKEKYKLNWDYSISDDW